MTSWILLKPKIPNMYARVVRSLPKTEVTRSPTRMQKKKKRDGALFPNHLVSLEKISFQELLTKQVMPHPNSIKSPKIKKKVQAAIKAIDKSQVASADACYLNKKPTKA